MVPVVLVLMWKKLKGGWMVVITGYLSNVKQEMMFYPRGLQLGFKFLLEKDLSALALGQHEIEGKRIYATVSEYETEPKEKRRPERHEKYLDIQYVCSGQERIGCGPLAAAGIVTENCLDSRDVIFYQMITNEADHILLPGMFAVYFPWDVHRPNCSTDSRTSKIRKIVVKVAMGELESNRLVK